MTVQALPKAANFGDLNLNQGKNHEIDVQLIEIGGIEHTKEKGTPYQKCLLLDQSGNQEKVTIWKGRNNTALADINLNKWLTFNLAAKTWQGKWQYSGFWQMETITQVPQNVPPPQNKTASTIVPDGRGGIRHPDVYAFPVTPETQLRMARSVGAEAASRVVAAMIGWDGIGENFDINGKLLELADMLAMWIGSGKANKENRICPHCQGDKTKCDCEPF